MTTPTPRPQMRTLGDYVLWQQGREPGMTMQSEMPRPPSGVIGAFETSAEIPRFNMADLKRSAERNRANTAEGRREMGKLFMDAQAYVKGYLQGRVGEEMMVLADSSAVIQWAIDAVADSKRSRINALPWTSEFKWRNVELEALRYLQGEAGLMQTFSDRLIAGAKTMRVPAFLDVVAQQLGGMTGPGTGGTGGNGKTTRTVSADVARAELSRFYGSVEMPLSGAYRMVHGMALQPIPRAAGIMAL